jgi:hypothetical protein
MMPRSNPKTMKLIKSFCGGVQGGQFFQKAHPLVAEGKKIKRTNPLV